MKGGKYLVQKVHIQLDWKTFITKFIQMLFIFALVFIFLEVFSIDFACSEAGSDIWSKSKLSAQEISNTYLISFFCH